MTAKTNLSSNLQDNILNIQTMMGYSSDLIVRSLDSPLPEASALMYLDGMVDHRSVQDNILIPLQQVNISESWNRFEDFELKKWVAVSHLDAVSTIEDALDGLLSGKALLLVNGTSEGLMASLPGWEDRSISESKTQSIVKGPQDSFTETLRTNTTLIRRRVKNPRVRIQTLELGRQSRTSIAVMYVEDAADQELVQHIVSRLKQFEQDHVLESEYLEEHILKDKRKSVFPLVYNSDRPDSIAAGIMEGKIAILVDGTPFVLLVPAVFADFMQSAEDYYQPYIYSSMIRLLRYLALFICLFAPATYIALTTHHQDMIPNVMLLSLIAQREGVPFPAFVEAIIMEVTFEILREAGIRMPRTVGQAVSIVGTIVIGQAAVEAGIVSAAMVIVVATTAISSFALPSYSMSIAVRILRFIFMGIAAMFGAYGLTIGVILLTLHLCALQPFGVPYLQPFAPYRSYRQEDAALRYPFFRRKVNGRGGE